MDLGNLNMISKTREYQRRAEEIQSYLIKRPDEWPRFQAEVSSSIDSILMDILFFQSKNQNNPEVIQHLKKIFLKRVRPLFLHGNILKMSYYKYLGYPGDFKIIDALHCNNATSRGFDRIMDNHFLEIPVSVAVRNRRSDFKRLIKDLILKKPGKKLNVMNLGCGSCRELKELFEENNSTFFARTTFDCYDSDQRALNYARSLVNRFTHVNFIQKNVARLALKKKIENSFQTKYDLIYSSGLFDYLNDRIARRLIQNLKKILNSNGEIIISNARDKQSNHSAIWMEWIMDWNLVYRTEEEFMKIFLDSGFQPGQLKLIFERQKIWQYCIATKG